MNRPLMMDSADHDQQPRAAAYSRPVPQHHAAPCVFRIMQGFVQVMGLGATSVEVPLYQTIGNHKITISGKSPMSLTFWTQGWRQGGYNSLVGWLRCTWWLLRSFLVLWPCIVDLYFLWKTGGIVAGGMPEDYPDVPVHAWQDVPSGVIPDTGCNILSFPIHSLGVCALWFVGHSRTQIIWHRLVHADMVERDLHQHRTSSSKHYATMLILVIFSVAIFFLRYTHLHVMFFAKSGAGTQNPVRST